MKLIDKLYYAWHNVISSKLRSGFTIIIVFILGIVGMALICMSIMFVKNTNGLFSHEAAKEPITINCYFGNDISEYNFTRLKDVFDDNSQYISNIYGNSVYRNYSFMYYTEYNESIILGNKPSASNGNTNSIYLEKSYMISYNIGDSYTIPEDDFEFIVSGFFENNNEDEKEYFIDLEYLKNNIDPLNSFNIDFYYSEDMNFTRTMEGLLNLQNDVEKTIPKSSSSSANTVYSSFLYSFSLATFMKKIVTFAVIFMFLVLCVLSLGSISNSIMISIDKNRRTFGIFSAVGMNKREIQEIVIYECIIVIVSGILLSYIGLFLLNNVIVEITNVIMNNILEYSIKQTDYVFTSTYPFYVPIITSIFFIGFTLLFARSSIKKIGSSSIIDVINEV